MLKLVQNDWGQFSLEFDDPALDDADAAAATLIYAALFTDASAPVGDPRIDDPFEQGGWWDDPQAGSGLWYLRRQPLSGAARREALDMVQSALTGRDPALTDIVVTDVTDPASAGSVSSVVINISGLHNGRKFIVRAQL